MTSFGALVTIGVAMAVLSLAGGYLMWRGLRPHAAEHHNARVCTQTGSAILTSAVVGGVLLLLQFWADGRAENRDQRKSIALQRDLSGIRLVGVDLGGIDMTGKQLRDADLSESDLRGASLIKTDLTGARLAEADMRDSQLRGARLAGAYLTGADLRNADGFDAHFEGAQLGPDARGAGVDLEGAKFINAHFRGACLARVRLRGAVLGGADLTSTVLTGADLRGARLVRDGVPANLDGAFLHGVQIDPDQHSLVHGARVAFARHVAARRPRSGPRPAPARAEQDQLVEVSDGDTVRFHRLGWVRLVGIDAPDPDPPVEDVPPLRTPKPVVRSEPPQRPGWLSPRPEPAGNAARSFLGSHIGKRVRYILERQPFETRDHGQFGRARAYVWIEGDRTSLNTRLIDAGLGRWKKEPQLRQFVQELQWAQLNAQQSGRGVWATCLTTP